MNLDWLPLNIFPDGSLASSVVTTVWVGVFVVAFFNLRFGWVLSGLVVPGYLVPLVMVKPWSVVAVLIEAVATYALARLLVAGCWRFGLTEFFGRDRFFLLVLISVLMRLFFDAWAFPQFGAWLTESFGIGFDYRNNLHSFGLVIIALIANQLWKPGLVRGMGTLLVQLLITYLLIRYGLMLLTNFSISNLSFLYEDIAASIQAGPKSYIILLISAWIASRMNLRYGWEYNGILIPSLLALQWYEPQKLLATFAEAFLILIAARMLLAIPLLASRNIEGARLLLLFFNVGFFYKLVLGYALLHWFPQVKVSDYFAFGYLLATLLAMKMYEKRIALRITRTTLQTSLVAVFAASIIGFALTFMPEPEPPQASATILSQTSVRDTDQPLEHLLATYKLALIGQRGEPVEMPLSSQTEQFEQALKLLGQAASTGAQPPAEALALLPSLGYELVRDRDGYWILTELNQGRGWGLFILNPAARSELILEVPRSASEKDLAEAAIRLLQRLQLQAVAISGATATANLDGTANVLLNSGTFFDSFHRVFSQRNVLQLRRYNRSAARELFGQRRSANGEEIKQLPSTLWVKRRLPNGLSLTALEQLLDHFETIWDSPGFENIQRRHTHAGFAELLLSEQDLRKLLTRTAVELPTEQQAITALQLDRPLGQWLIETKTELAAKGSNAYQVPTLGELRYFDEEVLKPLWHWLQEPLPDGQWPETAEAELNQLSQKARLLGYQLSRLQQDDSNQYLLLHESSDQPRRHWGSYLFRINTREPYLIEVPRPLFEQQTYEFGYSLFERLNATALLLAGAHPQANHDGLADVTQSDNRLSLFNLTHQIWIRQNWRRALMALQVRAQGTENTARLERPQSLLALDTWTEQDQQLDPLSARLLAQLRADGIDVSVVRGEQATAGMEFAANPQSLYSLAIPEQRYAVLWLPQELRRRYRQQLENPQDEALFSQLGWTSQTLQLRQSLIQATPSSELLPRELAVQINHFLEDRDIVTLRRLQRAYPHFRWHRLADSESGQSFLQLTDAQGRLIALANLNPGIDAPERHLAWPPTTAALDQLLHARASWIIPELP